ncbi:MAG: hypothetical protein ACR2KV_03665 [Solirubrobacteraceae bacterium]
MQRVLAVIMIVGVGLWAALPAAADTAPAGTLTAQPDKAGAASHLLVDAKGTGAGFGGAFPQGVTLALFKGFTLDLAAAGRCSDSAAGAGSCPANTQIAGGMVSGSASLAGLFATAVTAPVNVYLANASSGSLADVIVEVNVQGTTETARGHLVAVSDPTFGYEFRFDPLPPVMAPVGTTITLAEFTLDVGSSATGPGTTPVAHGRCAHGRAKNGHCKKKKKKKAATRRSATIAATTTVTHNLITNPTTCGGSWPTQLRVRFADHTQTLDAAIPCSS